MGKVEDINKLIEGRPELKCDLLYQHDVEDVKKILNMPEWREHKFHGLLTSNIWHCTFEEINKILNLQVWNDPQYKDLLTSNIWSSNADEIVQILNMDIWKQPQLLKSIIFCNKNGINSCCKNGMTNAHHYCHRTV